MRELPDFTVTYGYGYQDIMQKNSLIEKLKSRGILLQLVADEIIPTPAKIPAAIKLTLQVEAEALKAHLRTLRENTDPDAVAPVFQLPTREELPLKNDPEAYVNDVLSFLAKNEATPAPNVLRAAVVEELALTFPERAHEAQRARYTVCLFDAKPVSQATEPELLADTLGLLGWARDRISKTGPGEHTFGWIEAARRVFGLPELAV